METWLNFGPIAHTVVETFLNTLWQGLALAALVLCLMRVVKRTNATTRYLVWLAALLAVIALPLLSLTPSSPTIVRSTPVTARTVHQPQVVVTDESQSSIPRQNEPTRAITDPAGPVASQTLTFPVRLAAGSWPLFVFGFWLVVATGLTARVVWSYVHLQRLKYRSTPLGSSFQQQLERWSQAYANVRRVTLCSSREIPLPMVLGLVNPVILIPETLVTQLSEAELDQIGLHELAHIRRWDDWTNLLQKLVEAVFFFHPAVWWIGSKLDVEREIACDDWVIAITGTPRTYAACLTKLAQSVHHRQLMLAHNAVKTKSQLVQRVELLLDKQRDATPRLSRLGFMAVLSVLIFAAVQCAQVSSVIALPQSAPTADPRTRSSPRTRPVLKLAARPAPPVAPIAPTPPQPIRPISPPAPPDEVAAPVRVVAPKPPAPAEAPLVVAQADIDEDLKQQSEILKRETRRLVGESMKLVNQSLKQTTEKLRRDMAQGDVTLPSFPSRRNSTTMSGQDLRNADLHGTNLSGRNLSGSDLRGANLSGTNLSGANLSGSDLRGANLSGARVTGANLDGANLSGTNLSNTNLAGANLDGVDLRAATLSGAMLEGTNLDGADLSSTNLTQSNLTGANLDGANLSNAGLKGVTMTGANLDGADLRDADLSNAALAGANFGSAKLNNAKMSNANLEGTNFDGADLSGTNLDGANLNGANMTGAILTGTNLTGASLKAVVGLEK